MGFIPWSSAAGDSPAVPLPVASVVVLAPEDDSVDSNSVILTGNGTITSFGPSPIVDPGIQIPNPVDPEGDPIDLPPQPFGVTKTVTFVPSGGSIILTNSANLLLLGGANRTIVNKSIGTFQLDENDVWTELSFADTTQVPGSGGGGGGGTGTGVSQVLAASRSTAQSVAVNTWTKIAFTATTIDTQGGYSIPNGRWTCAIAGTYIIDASANVDSSGTSGGISIGKNGTIYLQSVDTGKTGAAINNTLTLVAGDYIEIFGYSSAGLFLAGSWLTIFRADTGAPGAGYAATSATTIAIGTGAKAFTTASGLAYSVGARVRASSRGTPTAFVEGLVSSYAGTVLTINADLTGGAGSFADWNINLAGQQGQQGPAGSNGAPGTPGTPGTPGAAGPGYLATSTSLIAIGGGLANFTTQAGLAYTIGARARASSNGTPTAWMEGLVTAYSGTTLTINVDLSNGSGSHADWNINLAGQEGIQGPAGPPGSNSPLGEAPTDGHNYARQSSAWNNIDSVFAPIASPVFTGDARAVTATAGDNDTSIATTAFVQTALAPLAPLASPTFTGDPKAPTPATADNDTSIATTAFVQAVLAASGYIPDAPNDANYYGRHAGAWSNLGTVFAALASPTFTGDPKAPTPTAGDNDTSIATTAFVGTAITNAAVPAPSSATPAMDGTGAAGSATAYARGDHVHPTDTSRAPLASPTFTGDPKAPTPSPGDNDTSIATTAFVAAAVAGAGGIVAQMPTVQRITASGAFTYTPTNAGGNPVRWIRIRCAASGGGGGANNGGTGSADAADLTFSQGGTLALTLGGGKKGQSVGGGAGGLVTVGTLPSNWTILFSAGGGAGCGTGTLSQWAPGGEGGVNMFGGMGSGGGQGSGTNAQDGTGAGGGGQAYGLASSGPSGAGGGAGACAEIIITNPGSGISFTGVLGNFGVGGAGAGRGGLGSVNIEEHYNY